MSADELPKVRTVLARGWHFLLPLVALVALLVAGYSPMRVGFFAILSVMAAAAAKALFSFATSGPSFDRFVAMCRRGIALTLEALELGARNAVAVSMACAGGGRHRRVVGLTGLGLKFLGDDDRLLGRQPAAGADPLLIASLILGMGLPVTAAYIVLIILVGPALTQEFGVPILIAHLVVFWYSQDSNVTPPVALAGFAARLSQGRNQMEDECPAWKYGKGLYLIPAIHGLQRVDHPGRAPAAGDLDGSSPSWRLSPSPPRWRGSMLAHDARFWARARCRHAAVLADCGSRRRG